MPVQGAGELCEMYRGCSVFCLSLRVLIDVHWGRLNDQLKVKRPEQDSKGLKVVCERVCGRVF